MKQYFRKNYYFLTGCLVAIGLSITLIVHGVEPNAGSGNKSRSLRDAAHSRGNVLLHRSVELKVIYNDLHALADPSTLVVIGTPVNSKNILTADEASVLTAYQFKIEETVKGGQQPGDFITVRLPGGRMDFGKGATAEVRYIGDGLKLLSGQRYALYLRAEPGNAYTFTGGPQGAFLLLNQGVRSNDHRRNWDPVVTKYQGMNVDSFLQQVRQSTKQ